MEKQITKQQMSGTVVSTKMDKTVVVKVDILKRHPKYHKSYTKSYRYKAHDEDNSCVKGDKVVIEAIRPMSRDKKFIVLKDSVKAGRKPAEETEEIAA